MTMWSIPGTPIPEPGVYPGMGDEEYFAVAAISNSRIGDFLVSPATFYHHMLTPQEDTPAMKLGRLYHCMMLQPDEVSKRYMVFDDVRGSTKAGKEALAMAAEAGLEAIAHDVFCAVEDMREAALQHPRVRFILEHPLSQFEVCCFWWETVEGVRIPCKAKLDIYNPDIAGGLAADLKSTVDASPGKFPKSVANYGYHRQAAWYSRGPKRAIGADVNAFGFICQEKTPPYLTGCYTLSENALMQGLHEIKDALTRLVGCMQSGDFPGYGTDFIQLDLPKWAQGE